ncbi:MAG: AsmA family protein [Bacteroidales bacterium]|nr:AsmA family protein [Bacteroidales bacterium]
MENKENNKKKLGRGWKIAFISLGSLVGLCVVVLAVAMWLVFTPSKLTKIVNGLSGKFITCEAQFGSVDLTLLSTFPDAGLKIEDVVLVNPMEGAENDTLAKIGSLTVGINVKAFLKDEKVIVHEVLLDDATANLYIDSTGKTNFDIVSSSDDDDDTSSTELPELIDLKKIKVSNLNADFVDMKDRMKAKVVDMDLSLKGKMDGKDIDGDLNVEFCSLFLDKHDSKGGEMVVRLTNPGLKASGLLKSESASVDAKVGFDSKLVYYFMLDSAGNNIVCSNLHDISLNVNGKGSMEEVMGDLKMKVEKGEVLLGEKKDMLVNDKLHKSKKDLLQVELPNLVVKPNKKEIWIDKSKLQLDDYALQLCGQLFLPREGQPLRMDLNLETDDDWQVAPLLDIIPEQYAGFRKGMDIDGKVAFTITASGALSDTTKPGIGGRVWIDKGRFYAPKILPYKIDKVKGALVADICLDKSNSSEVVVESLKAHTRNTDVNLSGRVDDLMGDMRVDAKVKASLPLADAQPMLPDSLPFNAKGTAAVDMKANFRLSQLKAKAFDKIKASGSIKLNDVDFLFDSIHAVAPDLYVDIQLPAKKYKDKTAEAHIKGSALHFSMGNIAANVRRPDINVGINDFTRQQIAAALEVSLERTTAAIDSTTVDLSALSLSGTLRLDSSQNNILKKLNPTLHVDLRQTVIRTPMLEDDIYFNNLDFHYTPELCDIADADFKLGPSDFQIYGSVENLEPWLSHEKMLTGELNFTSGFTDVDHLLQLISGLGSDKDSLDLMRKEDNVPSDANPFIVPKDVDFTLHTHIRRSLAFGNELGDLAGAVTINDGTAVLDQIGFVCKAATMQLTALYRSPRPNNLFLSVDFHLLDILVDELIDMIPTVDTLVPFLSAFEGKANFHLAAETFLDSHYKPKLSSLLGAAAISGNDLVVMDNSSIAQIAKLMKFKSWKEKDNKLHIDSLSVEMTAFRNEIEIYPFLLNVGKYQICASGKHTLDNQCGYHLELLKNPLMAKVGVDVRGPLSKPQISLGQVRYADLYKPRPQGVVEDQTLKLKKMIRQALQKNVR